MHTINNCYDNFATDQFHVVDGTILDQEHAFWNPTGTGVFNFHDVKITSVCGWNREIECSSEDILVKRQVAIDTVLGGGSAKMVNLDVEYQDSSILYGLKVGISVHDHEHGVENRYPIVVGDFVPVGLKNIWPSAYPSFQAGDGAAKSATYQSRLVNLVWNKERLKLFYGLSNEKRKYGILTTLEDTKELSIAFTVYGYNKTIGSECFSYGLVVGSIGVSADPAAKNYGASLQYVRGRELIPPSNTNAPKDWMLGSAEMLVRDTWLAIDFGNSVRRKLDSETNGVVLDTTRNGVLSIVAKTDKGENVDLLTKQIDDDWYRRTAGIIEVKLNDDQTDRLISLANVVIQVKSGSDDDATVWLSESEYYVRPLKEIFRFMNPGDKTDYKFFVTHRGLPVSKRKVSFQVIPYHTLTVCSTLKKEIRGAQKRCDCTYEMTDDEKARASKGLTVAPLQVTTDTDGEITVTLTADDPGNVRTHVDGMVYFIRYSLPGVDFTDYEREAAKLIFRVFDRFEWQGKGKPEPTWFGQDGVGAILKRYENLTPSMRHILSLGNYDSVVDHIHKKHILESMRASELEPGYMPVTRDLSKSKREMILHWLDQDKPKKGRRDRFSLEELKYQLQLALQVEFYTIPTYVYALYSIKEGANQEIAALIGRVIVDEMAHLAIVSNILNAIDGTPRLFDRRFIPVYPSRLPGGIEHDLVLRLAPLSIQLVRDVFMVIETPRQSAIDSDPEDIHNDTIGCFYQRIRNNLILLEAEAQKRPENSPYVHTIFTGNHSRQVDYIAKPVYNLTDALKGIDTIVTQGEGSSQLNPTDRSEDLAHYYKFAEIVHGHQLFKKANGNWDYVGKRIRAINVSQYCIRDIHVVMQTRD